MAECPDVKNYKRRLNPVWHRMLHSCTISGHQRVSYSEGHRHTQTRDTRDKNTEVLSDMQEMTYRVLTGLGVHRSAITDDKTVCLRCGGKVEVCLLQLHPDAQSVLVESRNYKFTQYTGSQFSQEIKAQIALTLTLSFIPHLRLSSRIAE